MRMRRSSWQIVVIAAAQAVSAPAEQLELPPRPAMDVILKTAEHDSLQGRLIELTPTGGLLLRQTSNASQTIPMQDLVRVETSVARAARHPRDIELILAGGSVAIGRLATGSTDELGLDTVDLGLLAIPLESVARINCANASSSAYSESVAWLDRQQNPENDRVLLANGDVLQGFVVSLNEEAMLIEGSLGETTVPYRLIVAVRFSGATAEPADGLRIDVSLRHSGRLTMRDLIWKGHSVSAKLGHGASVQFEAERVVQIDVQGGRWEWLSTHRPISFEHTPMLSLHWDFQADRNVRGGPIQVAGEGYDRGIGVHSRSSLTFDLKGEYQEFVTSFGLDDSSGPFADVSALILVDGQRRFIRQSVKRGSLYGPVRLDVTKANRIELVADYGENGDLQDRFNWVNAALIR